jgi:hypothetical protein
LNKGKIFKTKTAARKFSDSRFCFELKMQIYHRLLPPPPPPPPLLILPALLLFMLLAPLNPLFILREAPIEEDAERFDEETPLDCRVEGVVDARFEAEVPPDCRVEGVADARFEAEVPPDCRDDGVADALFEAVVPAEARFEAEALFLL